MARKNKGTEKKTGDGVLDLRHTGVARLDISPAGLTVPTGGGVEKDGYSFEVEGNI